MSDEPKYRVVDDEAFATMVLAGIARLPWMPSDGGVEACAGWDVERTVAEWLRDAKSYGGGWHCIGRSSRDGLYRIIGSDGGEPEDQTLVRGWAWVTGALHDAYNAGRHDAEVAQIRFWERMHG